MRYMLDTNICIYLIRNASPEIADRFSRCRKGEIGISSVTWAELCCGIRKDGAAVVEQLLSMLEVAPFGIEEGKIYGQLTQAIPNRKANLDRMMAAHALSVGACLVTNNEDDFKIYLPHGLQIENWVAAPD